MATIDNPGLSSNLPEALYAELSAAVKGGVYLRDEPKYVPVPFRCYTLKLIMCTSFVDYSKMFNGNVKTLAKVLVCPVDTDDVSR